MRTSDWSSDVCSSDLAFEQRGGAQRVLQLLRHGLGALRAECELAGGTGLVGVGDCDVVAGGHVSVRLCRGWACAGVASTAPRSEEHTSELQSLMRISYAVFCLKKKKKINEHYYTRSMDTVRTCEQQSRPHEQTQKR